MQTQTVEPWVLRLTLLVLASTLVALVGVIVATRSVRRRRLRAHARRQASYRADLLSLASGDDDPEAFDRLVATQGAQRTDVDLSVVAMLAKVRGDAALTLARVLDAHGVAQQARRRATSRLPGRRARAAWTLGLMRENEAAEALVPLLHDRRAVAIASARSLARLGRPEVAHDLLEALDDGDDDGLPLWVAVDAICALGPTTEAYVREQLASPRPAVQAGAAVTAGRAGFAGLAPALRRLLVESTDPHVCRACIEAIGLVGGPGDVATLAALADPDTVAGSAADDHGDHQTDAPDIDLIVPAIHSLGAIGSADAVPVLEKLVTDERLRIAEAAAEALVELGPRGERVLASIGSDGTAGAVARGALQRSRLMEGLS